MFTFDDLIKLDSGRPDADRNIDKDSSDALKSANEEVRSFFLGTCRPAPARC